VDNTAGHGLLGEHGLAFWIETLAGTAILDTGQGAVLPRNVVCLGLDISQAKAIILSHGHYDHTSGLAVASGTARKAVICIHPAALLPKFTRRLDGQVRSLGMSDSSRQTIEHDRGRVLYTEQPTEVLSGLYVTGRIPRVTDFEDTGGEFFLDKACLKRDQLADDQAVYCDTAQGLVVLLGCAHSGVVNSLMYVRQLTGNRPIHAVIGGMHLLTAGENRLSRTIAALREMNVCRIGLAHCTGFAAMARLHNEFPDRCFHSAAGTRLEFD
jgi:7,8-dihydropterin-6-yl-methyl-4-(beta-D-ribofuranosyl)aminobenzene 5'-phosphate synthase